MLPIGSVGMLTMIVAAYALYRAHDYGPLRMQGEKPSRSQRIQRSARCGEMFETL